MSASSAGEVSRTADAPQKRDPQMIFIVGAARSGTTMMSRILGSHPSVLSFGELHFFEELWAPEKGRRIMDRDRSSRLVARLLTIQRDGYFNQGDPQHYMPEADTIVRTLPDQPTHTTLLQAFLSYESDRRGKTIPCTQTPRNIYYLAEILQSYPRAMIVEMIRDPRAVLYSQKQRWRRRALSCIPVPAMSSIRAIVNYHPFTYAIIWNSAARAGYQFAHHDRSYQMHFEALVREPETQIRELCEFLGLEFRSEMIKVPRVDSSHRLDNPDMLGVDGKVAERWKQNGLSRTEIYLCQKVASKNMSRHGYGPEPVRPNPASLAYYALIWLPKLALATLLNLQRTRNPVGALKRRLGRTGVL